MIITVLGPIEDDRLGPTAVHEHVMVDFHSPEEPPRPYDRDEVVRVIEPYLMQLKQAGCAAFVDCTPEWLGRDPLVLRELALRTGLNIVTNAGWYNAPMVPPQAYDLDAQAIAALWVAEARDGIGGTGVRPGFLKIALNGGNHRPTALQLKILRAAALASMETGLPIVSHTIGSMAVQDALALFDGMAFDPERFVWAHADAVDGPLDRQIEFARRGMWISLDGVSDNHDKQVRMLQELIASGVEHRVLLSQDSGWYNVGEPLGGSVRPYHTLFTGFLPHAEACGVSPEILRRIVTENAARALRVRAAEGR